MDNTEKIMHGTEPYENLFTETAYRFKERSNLTILEIGVRKGFSSRAFLIGLERRGKGGREGQLYSIDIKNCDKRIKGSLRDNWTFIHGDSKKVEWNKPIHVLFIDGEHSYEGAKGDYDKYEPFVVDGGLIFMHDVCDYRCGLKQYWESDEIKHPKVTLKLERVGLGIINKEKHE